MTSPPQPIKPTAMMFYPTQHAPLHPPASPSMPPHASPVSSPNRISSKPLSRGDQEEDLPSKSMTTAQYLRVHANASPSKLRDIAKNVIFVHDDVDYLKRLVGDVGGMDYVFRFLWYDGAVPTDADDAEPGDGGGNRYRKALSGRSWIEHCCYRNAHQCLRWLFGEVVRNHLRKEREHRERLKEEGEQRHLSDMSSITLSASERQPSATDKSDGKDCGDVDGKETVGEGEQGLVKIIQQLLEYPSSSYCGANYVAVATLRNSYQCLSLLLEYGGLDPNAPINAHGATAAHLAAWKDHVECLRVLHSGTYACCFEDGDECDEELSFQSATSSQREGETDNEGQYSNREAFSSILTATPGKEERWSAEWTGTNALGETPLHVSAREGATKCTKFFLDMALAAASGALDEESERHERCVVDFSVRNIDGMDCAAVAAKHNQTGIISLLSDSIERLVDLSMDGPIGLASPVPHSPDFWHNPLSIFQPTASYDQGSPQAAKAPPQSPMPENRRRTKSEPLNIHSSAKKLAQSPLGHHQQQCLPHYFPTLNLRNSLEEHNHEMPIHVAARYGNCAVIEALFESGNCDTTARDSLGQTALHVAVEAGHGDACQMFVYLAGDDFESFDVVDILGRTPLYIACLSGSSPIARILIPVSNWRVICHERRKAPEGPLYMDVAQQPPLHAAVANNHVNCVGELLGCGVDVDQPDMMGRTAISAAAKLGYFEMVQMLIASGANVNTRSSRGGPTPYQKARKYKHNKVADLLYEFGGR